MIRIQISPLWFPLKGIQRLIRVLSFSGVVLFVMLGSSPPSLSLLLGVIRGFGLSFGFQGSAWTYNVWLFILSQFS